VELKPAQQQYMEEEFKASVPGEKFEKTFEGLRVEITADLNNLAHTLENLLPAETKNSPSGKELLKSQIESCLDYAQISALSVLVERNTEGKGFILSENNNLRSQLIKDVNELKKEALEKLAKMIGFDPVPAQKIERAVETQGNKSDYLDVVIQEHYTLPGELQNALASVWDNVMLISGDNWQNSHQLRNKLSDISQSIIEQA